MLSLPMLDTGIPLSLKIQATIAETFRRQAEVLGKRKSIVRGRNSRRRARGRGRPSGIHNTADSDDDEDEANGNDRSKESSFADEQSPPDDVRQQKRRRRWPSGSARSSPAKSTADTSDDASGGEDNEASGVGKETPINASPLKSGNMEVLSWGKNEARTQNRHATTGSLAGRLLYKGGGRVSRLLDHLRSLDENNEFIAVNLSWRVEAIEIYVKKPELGLPLKEDFMKDQGKLSLDWLELLEPQKHLSELPAAFSFRQGNMDLLYALKSLK